MNKSVRFNGIGYVAATFPVSAAAISYLKENHTEPTTGNVDINGKNLAVKLNTDGTVGFGSSTTAAGDALLGIIIAYEMDGFASVQIKGGIDYVPTKEAVTTGPKKLAVNNKGEIVVDATNGREVPVVLPSTSEEKFASIIL